MKWPDSTKATFWVIQRREQIKEEISLSAFWTTFRCCIHFGAPQYRKDIRELECGQECHQRGGGWRSCPERRGPRGGLVSLGHGDLGEHRAAPCLQGQERETGSLCVGRDNRHQVKRERFTLGIWRNLFPTRTLEPWLQQIPNPYWSKI